MVNSPASAHPIKLDGPSDMHQDDCPSQQSAPQSPARLRQQRRSKACVERRIAMKKAAGLPYEPLLPITCLPSKKKKPKTTSPKPTRAGRPVSPQKGKVASIQISPTPAYLAEAARPSTLLNTKEASKRRCLLVLDLNETLVDRMKGQREQLGQSHKAKTSLPRWCFARRPFLGTFLAYLAAIPFDVLVWTSAIEKNTAWVVRALGWGTDSTPAVPPLLGLWTRDHLGLSKRAFKTNVQTRKDLALVWSAFSKPLSPNTSLQIKTQAGTVDKTELKAANTVMGGEPTKHPWNASNTVLLDDNPEKAALQPHNHLPISTFRMRNIPDHSNPTLTALSGEKSPDPALLIVIASLERLRHQSNMAHFISNGGLDGVSEGEGVRVCQSLGIAVEAGIDCLIEREENYWP